MLRALKNTSVQNMSVVSCLADLPLHYERPDGKGAMRTTASVKVGLVP